MNEKNPVGRKPVDPQFKRQKQLCTTFRLSDVERIAAICKTGRFITPSELIYDSVMRRLPEIEEELRLQAAAKAD